MSKKIKAKSWSIGYYAPWAGDVEPYNAQYEYEDADGRHEVTKDFGSYDAAYGWLAQRIIL